MVTSNRHSARPKKARPARGRRRVKIGIDVGGTFTHAVALDADALELIGTSMVPTTHTAAEGVARGVVDSMHRLLTVASIRPEEVALIAHSTTQATNALLEGDVAPVGIIGMGKGVEGWRAKNQTRIDHVELAPGKLLRTHHRFLDTGAPLREEDIRRAMKELLAEGAQVFVASEAFGVDDAENERRIVELIRSDGHLATSASEISQLYGLKVRTRTAVINASMMPKMLETARMTESAVRASGISAPLMIMRSDGGIMDINEMRRRPILTMLSGPAAGVAAALMYVKISDGIFLEVGGTSTDISVIKNGRPTVRTAEVGGHRLYVRTLDIRTVGIGGGSMARLSGTRITDVGPRSAHIAGLRYVSFAKPSECVALSLKTIRPKPGDPDDYVALCVRGKPEPSFTFTTTEAANVLGLVQTYGKAAPEPLGTAARWLADRLRTSPHELADRMLSIATAKITEVVKRLAAEYKLDTNLLALVGGGGGAEVIVPYAARRLAMKHWMAHDAEVISAIGVALGMIQDVVERSIVNPTDADLLRIRTEAMQSVLRMGAAPESVDVKVEVDTKQKRVVATARGSPEMRSRTLRLTALPEAERAVVAAKSCAVQDHEIVSIGGTEFLTVYQARKVNTRFFGMLRSTSRPTRVIDAEGVVRLKLSDCGARASTVSGVPGVLNQLVDELTMYGDAGGLQPDVFVIVSAHIIDLSGLASKEQMLSLLRAETERFGGQEPLVALVAKKAG